MVFNYDNKVEGQDYLNTVSNRVRGLLSPHLSIYELYFLSMVSIIKRIFIVLTVINFLIFYILSEVLEQKNISMMLLDHYEFLEEYFLSYIGIFLYYFFKIVIFFHSFNGVMLCFMVVFNICYFVFFFFFKFLFFFFYFFFKFVVFVWYSFLDSIIKLTIFDDFPMVIKNMVYRFYLDNKFGGLNMLTDFNFQMLCKMYSEFNPFYIGTSLEYVFDFEFYSWYPFYWYEVSTYFYEFTGYLFFIIFFIYTILLTVWSLVSILALSFCLSYYIFIDLFTEGRDNHIIVTRLVKYFSCYSLIVFILFLFILYF